jgi:cytochrome c oxidase assembly protein subunit 15
MHKKIAYWLFACCFMIFAMAVIGAITRLTESGLSITEWKPIAGTLPPLNEAAWQHQFDLYKQSPEFAAKHFWMELGDFKKIFFWEWLHRLWGRTIGIVFALPLLWFWWKKEIPKGYGWRLIGLLALGGLQGAVGWYMVKSGLSQRPEVSHLRLALHLCLALFIYSATLWTALSLLTSPSSQQPKHGNLNLLALLLVSITIIWGAFVAGLDAGMAYNTFPMMNGRWTPDTSWSFHAMVFDPAWVQFTHRWLAKTAFVVTLMYAIRARSWPVGAMVCIQLGLGIATLLSQVALPLAALHQAGAVILLSLLIVSLVQDRRDPS